MRRFSMFRDTYKGYKNHSIKTLLANLEEGKQYPETGDSQDTQANSLCKVNRLKSHFGRWSVRLAEGGVTWVLQLPVLKGWQLIVPACCCLPHSNGSCTSACGSVVQCLHSILQTQSTDSYLSSHMHVLACIPHPVPTQACGVLSVLCWLLLSMVFPAAAGRHCCVRWL